MATPSGRFIASAANSEAYRAFVPDPFPPAIAWDHRLVNLLSRADRALGTLAGIGRNLLNPTLLVGPFARREAILSSKIEGTRATASDLLLFEAQPESDPNVADVGEVSNYLRALEYGLKRLESLPLSPRLIREMHGILLEGVRGQAKLLGEFRRVQNFIGPPGSKIHQAMYVPPPVPEMKEALYALEAYLHASEELPLLVRLALIHYQFEAIHPFEDGNGRIGRLLIVLLLCKEGALPGPLFYLSAFFEEHRREYYDHLLVVSHRGQWSEWIEFFLRGVVEQAADAAERARRLIDLREAWRGKLATARSSALLLRFVDLLFECPAVNSTTVCKRLHVRPQAALDNIQRLVGAGILSEVTGQKRNRVWVAVAIREVIE